jgi:hypothetical protein
MASEFLVGFALAQLTTELGEIEIGRSLVLMDRHLVWPARRSPVLRVVIVASGARTLITRPHEFKLGRKFAVDAQLLKAQVRLEHLLLGKAHLDPSEAS